MSTIIRNALWGVMWGLVMAVWFALIATVIYAVAKAQHLEGHPMTLQALIGTYFAGCVLAGLAVGLLRPLGKRWWGAMLIGLVAAFLTIVSVAIAMEGWLTEWDQSTFEAAVTYSLLAGPAGGLLVWWKYVRNARPKAFGGASQGRRVLDSRRRTYRLHA